MKKHLKPNTLLTIFVNSLLIVSGGITFLGNGPTLNLTNGSTENYSIPELIKHEVATTYNISLPGNQEGYSLVAKNGSNTTVSYGGSFTFIFTLFASHSKSSPLVKINGSQVNVTSGEEYSIWNINQNINITVENVIINTYTITWDVEGDTSTTEVTHGDLPAFDGTPSKALTETEMFIFSGWTPEIIAATEDTTYTAIFDTKSIKIESPEPNESNGEVAAELIVPEGVVLDAVLVVKILQEATENITIPDKKVIFKIYNVALLDEENNDISESVSSEMTLRFATPDKLNQREGIQIILEGESEPLSCSLQENFVEFDTDKLGNFAVIVDVKPSSNFAIAITISIISAFLLVFISYLLFAMIRKRQKEEKDKQKSNI